jgi:signal transduction histidine kinase
MHLATFIFEHAARISKEWEKFAATHVPAARVMSLEARRDHIDAILQFVAADVAKLQTDRQQADKARGPADEKPVPAARSHGIDRALHGFTPAEMLSEFRALRACVVRMWLDDGGGTDRGALEELTRFHEAIDQVLAQSAQSYTQKMDRAKDLFVGVLGHDLRSPLAAILMGATAMITEEGADWSHAKTASRILRSGMRMEEMIRDLLDFTRGRLGGGIAITPDEMDLDALIRQSVDEISATHSRCTITLASKGAVVGMWDRPRLSQVLSNLIGNACQHGSAGETVEVTLASDDESAVVTIYNRGPVIPAEHLRSIFEPFRRLAIDQRPNRTNSVGLGLYIAKEIVSSHHGTIEVESVEEGTTFTVTLPRAGIADAAQS